MARVKDINGTSPSYKVIIRDEDGGVVNPLNLTKIEIFVHNMASGTLVEQFSYPAATGFTLLAVTTSYVPFVFTTSSTIDAESGDNTVRIKLTSYGAVDEVIGVLNEFIDTE
jgi:hypothetical protein